ncbi:MAG TPA: type II secretion system F family protein [Bryobacteraceae bacterium]|jgi:tight adherence protein C|nr:type II secretion system F family protein [Bryobacteraceae bacterium]
MILAIVAFTAVFLLVASILLLVFYRDTTVRRLAGVVSTQPEGAGIMARLSKLGSTSTVESIVQPFQKVLPRSPLEASVIQKRLIRAGYRKDAYVNIFYGAKVITPVLLFLLASVVGLYEFAGIFGYATAVAVGFLVPDFWLSNRIAKRQMDIRVGLPEALDLLVVCAEAGLGLDQAIMRVADELAISQPEISDELSLTVLEQRAGRSRADAWKNLAERTNVDSVRAMVATLQQADHFGTSVSKTLRGYSDTLRVQRRQQIEELAAKTTVKLVFPLALFIFPTIFVVTLGPAVIALMEGFTQYFHH